MYLYCPRKFFLQKIVGIPKPASKEMIEGRIRHEILETFSKREQAFVESLESGDKEKIISIYQQLLSALINQSFQKNRSQIFAFKISSENLQNKILFQMQKEIELRADSISEALKSGFIGKSLWENLKPKYLSEFEVFSETLGLKGRIDRLVVGDEIIPFELKTREAEKIYESDEIQVTAYAMLLEERFQRKINLGVVEAGNKRHEINISQDLRNKVFSLIEEINSLKDNPKFPFNFSKCQKCNYKKECDEL